MIPSFYIFISLLTILILVSTVHALTSLQSDILSSTFHPESLSQIDSNKKHLSNQKYNEYY